MSTLETLAARLSALEETHQHLAHEIDEQATRTVAWCERLEARLDQQEKLIRTSTRAVNGVDARTFDLRPDTPEDD